MLQYLTRRERRDFFKAHTEGDNFLSPCFSMGEARADKTFFSKQMATLLLYLRLSGHIFFDLPAFPSDPCRNHTL